MSNNSDESICEGTFAPDTVIQSTTASIKIINGTPSHRLVTSRSSVASRSNRERRGPRVTHRSAIPAASA